MKISKRLYAISDAVTRGESVADIGTDHGYVPILLCRENKSPKLIMCDISEHSLAKARASFDEEGISPDGASFRVGDGLDPIEAGEVDTVVIAGLGGATITEILGRDVDKTRSYGKLILQPRKHAGTLRYWLYVNGFEITRDILVIEGKFSCDIIVAVPCDSGQREAPYPCYDIRWSYPESFAGCDRKALLNRTEWKLSSIADEIEQLKRSNVNRDELIASLTEDRKYIEGLIRRNEET